MNEDNEETSPYNENNCYNIFQHSLKITTPASKKIMLLIEEPEAKVEGKPESWIELYLINILRNARICIKGIHLRLEDDFYSSSLPYAFGLISDVFFIALLKIATIYIFF